MLVSFGQLIGFALVFIALAQGMHLPISDTRIVLFMPFIFLISSLPIFYQGWGGREAVVILTIGGLGTVSDRAGDRAVGRVRRRCLLYRRFQERCSGLMRPSMRKSVRMEVEQT